MLKGRKSAARNPNFAGERKIKISWRESCRRKAPKSSGGKNKKFPNRCGRGNFFSFLFSDFCGYFAMTFSTGSPSMNNPPIAVKPCFCRKITYIGLPLLFASFRIAETFSLSNLPVE